MMLLGLGIANAVRRSMRAIRTAIGTTTINPELLTRRSRRSSVEQDIVGTSFAKLVAARVRMSSGHGKARTTPTCPFWTLNGPRAAVTAQSSGVVFKDKAYAGPCV